MSTKSPFLSRDEYYSRLRTGDFNDCGFCGDGVKQVVLDKGKHWLWVASISPYWKYHTMLVPVRHISDIEDMTMDEFGELKSMKRRASRRFAESGLSWLDGSPITTFTYMWRVRQGGIDHKFNTIKSTHLHIHMWPETNGRDIFNLDPEATDWNPEILRTN